MGNKPLFAYASFFLLTASIYSCFKWTYRKHHFSLSSRVYEVFRFYVIRVKFSGLGQQGPILDFMGE